MGEKSEILRTFVTLIMKKKSNDRRGTRRTGKTGATGIIRETGTNGMSFGEPGSDNKLTTNKLSNNGKPAKSANKSSKSVRKHVPVILVTNDDGINAPGIRNLVEAVKGLGKVVVVAPDKPQSGMGHAITIGNPLRLNPMHHLFDGVEAWQCSGTPVDV